MSRVKIKIQSVEIVHMCKWLAPLSIWMVLPKQQERYLSKEKGKPAEMAQQGSAYCQD